MRFEYLFEFTEVKTEYMKNILSKTFKLLSKSVELDALFFGPLCEGPTISGEAAEVTEEGLINLDSYKLQEYDEDVAMAIIAHEIAHYNLGHYDDINMNQNSLNNEQEADDLAKSWGFDIEKFRSICGPATLK
ncbi:MAG TPA: hypothetical protein DD713_08465 [Nitrospiraceae bacterium]|nr:hypothetical protein [Nitrospiraceae bacterium]